MLQGKIDHTISFRLRCAALFVCEGTQLKVFRQVQSRHIIGRDNPLPGYLKTCFTYTHETNTKQVRWSVWATVLVVMNWTGRQETSKKNKRKEQTISH